MRSFPGLAQARPPGLLRAAALRVLGAWQARVAVPLCAAELALPAVVFAPHPDDETLGCGGTIARKRRLGAAVEVVFVTDGAGSHPSLIDRASLAEERGREALAAAATLGVGETAVHRLGFPDGALGAHARDAGAAMRGLLAARRPAQIFLPDRRDEHPDHAVTHDLVMDAARELELAATLFAYPIWFWNHWPWVALEGRPGDSAWRYGVRVGARAGFGVRAAASLNAVVDVSEVLATKHAALAEHRTQTQRRQPGWWTLGDVAGGSFMQQLLRPRELFRRVELSPGATPGSR